MPPFFFKTNKKGNADVNYKVLMYHVLSWLKRTLPRYNYAFTHDGNRHKRPKTWMSSVLSPHPT
uniref:Uncharacterized protein n=1 Tax=Lepeophtheirus salmonis TaxID=72036 RepID=A0A0K2VIK4_LEPSM